LKISFPKKTKPGTFSELKDGKSIPCEGFENTIWGKNKLRLTYIQEDVFKKSQTAPETLQENRYQP